MSVEQNKQIVRSFYEEVMNHGNTAILDEIMDMEFDDHGEALFGSPHGRTIIAGSVNYVHGILPDLHVGLEDMIGEGEYVGVRGTMRCTHTGPFAGVDPTGNELSWKGLAMFRVVDGKIVQRWFNSDSLSIMTQLGLYPPPERKEQQAEQASAEDESSSSHLHDLPSQAPTR
jgi:predicted ester cyclase